MYMYIVIDVTGI